MDYIVFNPEVTSMDDATDVKLRTKLFLELVEGVEGVFFPDFVKRFCTKTRFLEGWRDEKMASTWEREGREG